MKALSRSIEGSTEFIKKNKKTSAITAVGGLNAAVIVFLYSHFVPVNQYNDLKTWVGSLQKQVTELKSEVDALKK